MKKLLFGTILLVLIFGLGCAKSGSTGEDNVVHIKSNFKSSVNKDFGKATLKLLDKKQYKLACVDAKMLYFMINNIAKAKDNSPDNQYKDDLAIAELEFENAQDVFEDQLEKYEDNEDARDGILGGMVSIVEIIMIKDFNNFTDAQVDEYIDIELCGKKAPEGWTSPVPTKDFGKATLKLLDKKQYKFACIDAKMFYYMMDNVVNAQYNDDSMAGIEELELENTINAMELFEDRIEKYEDNKDAIDGITKGIMNIVKVFMAEEFSNITDAQVDEYIDIKLCGKKAPKGWVSPVEQFFEKGFDKKIPKDWVSPVQQFIEKEL